MKPFQVKNPNPRQRDNASYNYSPYKHGVSQSILSTWLDCTEKSRLATRLGWSPFGVSKPLTFGDLSHGVLELAYLAIQDKKVSSLSALRELLPKFMKLSEKAYYKKQPATTTTAKDLVEECAATIEVLLPLYFEKWWNEDSKVKWIAVEQEFAVPVTCGKKTVNMVGKFDGVFHEKGQEVIFETKNKGQWSSELVDLLPLDLQLSYYIAARKKDGFEPSRVRYNLIRRPGERRKVTEPLKDFVERIAENVRKDPAHYFERYDEQLDDADIARYVDRAHFLVRKFVAWFDSTEFDQRQLDWNSNHCENKYGTCPFLPICARGDFGGHFRRADPSPELAPIPTK